MSDQKSENPEAVRKGAVTTYRPDDDRLSGGRDHSVQSEARGEKGAQDIASNSATSGGSAGKMDDMSDTDGPKHD